MKNVLGVIAEIIAVGAAILALIGVGVDYGFCQIAGDFVCKSMTFNDHINTAFNDGSFVLISLFIITFLGYNFYEKLILKRLPLSKIRAIKNRINNTPKTSNSRRRLYSFLFFLLGLAFSGALGYISGYYRTELLPASSTLELRAVESLVFNTAIMALGLVGFFLLSYVLSRALIESELKKKSSNSRTEKLDIPADAAIIRPLLLVCIVPIIAWFTLNGFGALRTVQLLHSDGVVAHIPGLQPKRIILLRSINDGFIIFDPCSHELSIIRSENVKLESPSLRFFNCGYSGR